MDYEIPDRNQQEDLRGIAGGMAMTVQVFRVHLARPAPRVLMGTVPAPGPLAFLMPLSRLLSSETRAFPRAHDPEGVFVVDGIESAYLAKDDPAEGVRPHVPVALERTYDPTEEAEAILTAATGLDPEDETAILKFVNTWGLLGAAEPDASIQLWDSVALTKSTLAGVKYLATSLKALQQRRWDDPTLPSIREEQNPIRNDPQPLHGDARARARWAAFARVLNERLSPVRPQLLPAKKGLRQLFRPRCIADLLYLTIWRQATEEDLILRKCRACRGLYSVARTNGKKKYCSPRCKNRATVRKWRSKQAKKERRRPNE
jgi:hypothetical protein